MNQIPTIEQLTPSLVSLALSILLSLIFRYIPGALAWFDKMGPEQKQAFMGVGTTLIVAAVGIWNFAHTGLTEANAILLAFTWIASLQSNAMTFNFTKRPPVK